MDQDELTEDDQALIKATLSTFDEMEREMYDSSVDVAVASMEVSGGFSFWLQSSVRSITSQSLCL